MEGGVQVNDAPESAAVGKVSQCLGFVYASQGEEAVLTVNDLNVLQGQGRTILEGDGHGAGVVRPGDGEGCIGDDNILDVGQDDLRLDSGGRGESEDSGELHVCGS